MFAKLPMIRTADYLIDYAIKKGQKTQIYDRNQYYKKKKTIIAQTETFTTHIIQQLESYVKQFPSLEQLPQFYQELISF